MLSPENNHYKTHKELLMFGIDFKTFVEIGMVIGLILFPLSIIGKFVLIAVLLKSLRSNTGTNPFLAILLGPSALMLSRMQADADRQQNKANSNHNAPGNSPIPEELL